MKSQNIQPAQAHQSASKVGVLLVNLGTPNAPTARAVRPYLKQFLSDRRVVEIPRVIWWFILNCIILPIRSGASAKKYQLVWIDGVDGGSPLFVHSKKQAELLGETFKNNKQDGVLVKLAMRYGAPGIESVMKEMGAEGVKKILVLPLYPQYSATTSASTFDEVFRVLMQWRDQPGLRIVRNYHDHPLYIAALKRQVEKYWENNGRPNFDAGDKLIMSFHGVPKRTLDLGDPYHCECHKTGRLLREALGLTSQEALTTFQSRFGKAEWLKPYTAPTLELLGNNGIKRVDLFCPGFPADCLETLEEIAMEGQHIYKMAGGESYHTIPCLNDSSEWITALNGIALENLQGWNLQAESSDVVINRKKYIIELEEGDTRLSN